VPLAKLVVENLSCVKDRSYLFKQLNFTLSATQSLYVYGLNGAGKTTLLKMIAGILEPDQGKVFWDQVPIEKCHLDYCRQLGYLGHKDGLKNCLTALENLAALVPHGSNQPAQHFAQALTQMGLRDRLQNLPCQYLSAGQKRRVAWARLLVRRTTIWLLDEPFTSLDTQGLKQVMACMEHQLKIGGMIIYTSHQPLFSPSQTLSL
jgi:heme exporter protein A